MFAAARVRFFRMLAIIAAAGSSMITSAAWGYTVYGATANGILTRFDSASPASPILTVLITGLGAGESIIGLDFRLADGRLYAVTRTSGNLGHLYSLNTETGAAALAAELTGDGVTPYVLNGAAFGMDFQPVVDRLRIVSDTGMNIRVNPANGIVFTDAALNPGTFHVVGAGYTNAFRGASTTTLFDVDVANDVLLLQGTAVISPNGGALTSIGPLGIAADTPVSFDVFTLGANNTGYATFSVAGTVRFFLVNLVTGAATLVGNIGGNLPIVGLAVEPDTLFRNGFD